MSSSHVASSEPLPSLQALRAFDAVCRLGSITAAARELCVTQGAVSHLMSQLERWFGRPLLSRTPRGGVPTPAGHRLAETTGAAFSSLTTACRELRSGGSRTIELGAPASFLAGWILPRLETFERGIPGLSLRLRTDADISELRSGSLDALVVLLAPPWPDDLEVFPIAPERLGLVRAPGPGKDEIKSLLRRKRLAVATRPDAWAQWCRSRGIEDERAPDRVFDHLGPLLEAVRLGLGVAVVPELPVRGEIDRGHLVAPLGFIPGPGTFALALLRSRSAEKRLSAFAREVASAAQLDIAAPRAMR